MAESRVERGTTAKLGRVDGDLWVGKGAKIVPVDGWVTVAGAARFDGDATVASSLKCDSLSVERGALVVSGDLSVSGRMDVAHTVRVGGWIRAERTEVGGRLYAGSVSSKSVRVGGIVDVANALEAEAVDVGGKIRVGGDVNLKDLGVGGMAEVGGGKISGRGTVGGVFTSKAPLEFGEMHVYGKCTLPGGSRGQKISTWGRLTVDGNIQCEEVDVGGTTLVKGDASSRKVTINGKFEVRGSLFFKETLDSFGMGEVGGEAKGSDLRVAGRFKADSIVLTDRAEVSGEVDTARGMKANQIAVSTGSRCRGPIVGEKVELSNSDLVLANWSTRWAGQTAALRLVGRMTSTEDVYGDEVVLGANTRCKRVFARTIQLASGCILDQATYTGELRHGNSKVFFLRPPEKVEKLPPFPL